MSNPLAVIGARYIAPDYGYLHPDSGEQIFTPFTLLSDSDIVFLQGIGIDTFYDLCENGRIIERIFN